MGNIIKLPEMPKLGDSYPKATAHFKDNAAVHEENVKLWREALGVWKEVGLSLAENAGELSKK